MLIPNSAAVEALAMEGGFPALVLPDGRKLERPSREWTLHNLRWRWLLDSYEGGEAYRTAVYGVDLHGMPVRNLIRHKREYPDPVAQDAGYSVNTGRPRGTDQANQATDDDYELRRARTPIPTFTSEAIGEHTSKIYNQEVKRAGPPKLEDWWEDVDGSGVSMDQFMADTVSHLLLLFGQLDVIVEHPPAPEGEEIATQADVIRLGLDKCVASYILPVNIPWWKVDRRGRYVECLVREVGDDDVRFRHWDSASWTLYDCEGKRIGDAAHDYGRVPIVRCFDHRRPSCRFVGRPRYEAIAEIQREYYNRDSELILSDTTQAHPLLQGPEDFIKADGTIPVGPNWLLPKKKNTQGGSATYEGFDVVPFPKDGAESIRLNKSDLRDAADRSACLTKPAGAAGTTGQTVGQSGVSKRLDQSTGNELLGKIAKTLQRAEETISELAAVVLGVAIDPGGESEDANKIKIQYPGEFDLYTADELMVMAQSFVLIASQVGNLPVAEKALLSRIERMMLPGMDDEEYDAMDKEIDEHLEEKAQEKAQQRESTAAAASAPDDPAATDPNNDPAGTSAPDDQPDEGD